jgi:hypothetical protein
MPTDSPENRRLAARLPIQADILLQFIARHRNRLRMDIQAYKSYVSRRRLPFTCGSAPQSFPIRSVIRDAANREPVVPW